MNLNVSVLAAARETYLRQLKILLTPLIHEGFVSLWEDAIIKDNEQGGNNPLKQFQLYLKDIPNWNQSILEEETKRIIKEVDFLMELVAGVFISQIKILASVRLNGNNKEIKLKIPAAEVFVHTVYTNSAEMFYYDPFVFLNHKERPNYEKIRDFIQKSIDDTIDSMIPIESIIKEYLSNVFSGHVQTKKTIPNEEEAYSRLLTSEDMNLDDSNFNEKFTTGRHFGGNGGNGGNSGNDDFEIGKNFSGNDDFEVGNDGNDDKYSFKDDYDEVQEVGDLSGGSDPFSSGGAVESSDPFSSSGPAESSDPFSSAESSDPFSSSGPAESSDPFSSSGPAESSDPFSGGGADSDPFSSGGADSDPFSGGGNSDPFSGGGNSDPFSSGTNSDPFST